MEHIFSQVPGGGDGDFKIRISNASGGSEWPEGYGLEWWVGELNSIDGDFDGDKEVDDNDLTGEKKTASGRPAMELTSWLGKAITA